MESKAVVPAGGIQCGIPVKKVGTPTSVLAGQDQTVNYTITVPATASAVLGNCKGNASANAASLSGLARVEAAALTGNAAFNGNATTLAEAAPLVQPATQGPTPVGGVQTGAGGASPGSNRLLPIAAASGSVALVTSLIARRRRRIG